MAYTEHVLKLPDGIHIAYTDSGAPNSSDYTTVVLVHGMVFNRYAFTPLHPLAHQHNVRLLCCQRRGYPGSTAFTDEEMEDMREGRQVFQDRLALQLAWFLRHFIENEHTPRVNEDRSMGGFVLGGWSLGNVTTMSLLADPTVVKGELYDAIEPYLRTLVMYDPPSVALGYPAPLPDDQMYSPSSDPHIAPEDVYKELLVWLSAFYDHPGVASGKGSGVNCGKPGRTSIPTVECYTEEERSKCCLAPKV
ncbi:hypothetical protein FB45DRAFT_993145 [Roridomyces roridus]|uniref:AB hydrolase-1 domain-containing protein n=1 Tax=Roridomyces roridus TaxID=1738132 RepID=A0AAD7FCQ0_9AGAR|nr:hypothetical protein FB45DRAFT_993145 [Roridomyces roridus]